MDIVMFRDRRLTRVMVWSERVFSIVGYFVVVAYHYVSLDYRVLT